MLVFGFHFTLLSTALFFIQIEEYDEDDEDDDDEEGKNKKKRSSRIKKSSKKASKVPTLKIKLGKRKRGSSVSSKIANNLTKLRKHALRRKMVMVAVMDPIEILM